MKKLIPLFMLLVGASGALAQGVVLFANQPLGTTRRVFMPDGTTLVSGTQFKAELYYQNNLGQWVAHSATADFFASTLTTFRGYWNGANRTLVNAGGVPSAADPARANPVQIEIRVWDSTTGNSYDTASLRGSSGPIQYIEEFDVPAGTDDKQMKNLTSFRLVPEPSVIGLGVIGVGALLLLRRRK